MTENKEAYQKHMYFGNRQDRKVNELKRVFGENRKKAYINGVYFDNKKKRYVQIWKPDSSKDLKKMANRKFRRDKQYADISGKGNYHKKANEYRWNLI